MFRTKVLIFMIPLLLPIGQPPVQAYERMSAVNAERTVQADVAIPDAADADVE